MPKVSNLNYKSWIFAKPETTQTLYVGTFKAC